MNRLAGFFALALAFAVATALGWWAVPVVAILWGATRPGVPRPAVDSALAAGLAWAAWLCYDKIAGAGALGVLTERLAGVMNLPAIALLLLTIFFPVLLAWSATALAGGLADLIAPRSGDAR